LGSVYFAVRSFLAFKLKSLTFFPASQNFYKVTIPPEKYFAERKIAGSDIYLHTFSLRFSVRVDTKQRF